ncbi:hypothetical protein DIE07_07515 [Burkholderia sp. Bp9002]|nr:hypothetical protein DIE07_07515 [Burkholderia sp. Bp9002]
MGAAALSGPCRPAATQRRRSAWRGNGHGLIPCAGSVDDSEVVRDSPIKCRDDFHSISHYFSMRDSTRKGRKRIRVPRASRGRWRVWCARAWRDVTSGESAEGGCCAMPGARNAAGIAWA